MLDVLSLTVVELGGNDFALSISADIVVFFGLDALELPFLESSSVSIFLISGDGVLKVLLIFFTITSFFVVFRSSTPLRYFILVVRVCLGEGLHLSSESVDGPM